jgi:hypothetical protein
LLGLLPGEVDSVGPQNEFPPAKGDGPQPLPLKIATATDAQAKPPAEFS